MTASALFPSLILGFAAGLRSLTPPGALAVQRGRPAVRAGFLAAAAGELLADKHPATPDRRSAPALGGRLLSGAAVGRIAGGTPGAVVGAAAAAAGTFAGAAARRKAGEATGLPDAAIAVAEDVAAIALALAGARAAS